MRTIKFRRVSATKPRRPLFARTDLRGRDEYLTQAQIRENRDCTVRTVALAADVPYADAHAACELCGRVRGRGFHGMEEAAELLDTYLELTHSTYTYGVDGCPPIRRQTVETWVQRLSKGAPGRYVLGTRGHVFAIVVGPDGGITASDTRYVPRALVTEVYTVKPLSAKSW